MEVEVSTELLLTRMTEYTATKVPPRTQTALSSDIVKSRTEAEEGNGTRRGEKNFRMVYLTTSKLTAERLPSLHVLERNVLICSAVKYNEPRIHR